MNKTRVLALCFVALFIWNILLTSKVDNISKNDGNIINEYEINGYSTDLTKTFESVENKCVMVQGKDTGTGFIYKKDTDKFYVITASHIVNDIYAKVTLGNSLRYEAKVIGKDVYSDIAVLEVDSPISVEPVRIGQNKELKDGEFLVISGFTNLNEFSRVNKLLMVSNSLETVDNSIIFDSTKYTYYIDMISFAEDLENGFSGAGVFNMNGDLTGMVCFKDNSLSYALTADEIKIVADSIIENGSVYKRQFGFKGTYIKSMKNYLKTGLNIGLDVTGGLYIDEINHTGVGHASGIKVNDILISINNIKIDEFTDLLKVAYLDTKDYSFTVLRNGETLVLNGSVQ